MAKVFTTSFQYKGDTYSAVVTQSGTSVNISLPDTDLHTLMPDSTVVHRTNEEEELTSAQATQYQDLLAAILAAVEASGALHHNVASTTNNNKES